MKNTSITLGLWPELDEDLRRLGDKVPLASRHAVALATLKLGLDALHLDPSGLQALILDQRGRFANKEGM